MTKGVLVLMLAVTGLVMTACGDSETKQAAREVWDGFTLSDRENFCALLAKDELPRTNIIRAFRSESEMTLNEAEDAYVALVDIARDRC